MKPFFYNRLYEMILLEPTLWNNYFITDSMKRFFQNRLYETILLEPNGISL